MPTDLSNCRRASVAIVGRENVINSADDLRIFERDASIEGAIPDAVVLAAFDRSRLQQSVGRGSERLAGGRACDNARAGFHAAPHRTVCAPIRFSRGMPAPHACMTSERDARIGRRPRCRQS